MFYIHVFTERVKSKREYEMSQIKCKVEWTKLQQSVQDIEVCLTFENVQKGDMGRYTSGCLFVYVRRNTKGSVNRRLGVVCVLFHLVIAVTFNNGK